MRRSVLCACLAIPYIAPDARADANVAPIRVDAIGCIDGASFAKRLVARGVVGPPDTIAEVRTADIGAVVEGTLVLRRVIGVTTRVMRASSCDDVADALAFTLALALEAPPDDAPPNALPPLDAPPTNTPSTATVAAPPRASPSISKPSQSRPSEPDTLTDAPKLAIGAAVAWGATIGPGPDPAQALDIAISIGTTSRTRSLFAPAIVVGPSFVFPATYEATGYSMTLAFQGGTADLCPFRAGARAGLRLCGRFVAGRSQARADGVVAPRLDERAYLAAGPSMRGELPIHGRIAITAIFSTTFPFARDEYFLGVTRAVVTPPVAFSGAFGVGVSIP